jgi:hypothetical protein
MEQIEHEFVRIGPLRPPDHAPHGGVPFVAVVPDEIGELRPRHAPDLDVEAELAPFLRDQLRRLKLLRIARLRG